MKNKSYSSSNKTVFKILSDVKGQYLYSRAKPRGVNLNIMQ